MTMAKPSTDLLDSLSEDASPRPQAKVTVEVESEPDYAMLADAYRAALKGSDPKALCMAVAAMCACCEPSDMGDTED